MTGRRLPFIDWFRGIGVLIMIEAHVFDAWMRLPDRGLPQFRYERILAGWAAPTFLFLAGLSLTMVMGRHLARGLDRAAVARAGLKRGWRIFGLALLFRSQSLLMGGGTLQALLKVDILNVMGLAMVATAALWSRGRTSRRRGLLLVSCAALVALAAPLVQPAAWPATLPDALEGYLRALPGRSSFSLFPWPGFVMVGGAAGLAMATLTDEARERRTMGWFAGVGAAAGALGYGLSFLPSPYAQSDFWTSSPAFFLLRCGVLLLAVAATWALTPVLAGAGAPAGRWLARLGTSSLFVYWIHVEIVYGMVSDPFRRRFSFNETIVVYGLFVLLVYGMVLLKDALLARWSGGDWFGTRAETLREASP
ncbi:MAG: heparan-alpha-glucosaminide N-acetyltransferase domain-containing protein [Vicinamibacterales bacterium]